MDKFAYAGAALARFAIRRPVTVSMLFFSLLLLGIAASRLLPLEKWPGIDIPEIVVNIPYRDATPAEIEKMITRPVEEALATMSGIKRMRSNSSENNAQIHLQFAWDENIKAKSIEAREKIDAVRHLLPDDVERILVFKFNTNDMPVFQLRVSSERDLSNAYDLLARNLKMPLERVHGVSKVELYGVQNKQIAIRLDAERIAALHVDSNKLSQALRKANFSMTAGHFYDQNQKITVNPEGEFRSIEEVTDLYIDKHIRLGDIAEVGYETPRRTEGRHLDQSYAVGLEIFRESNANLVEVSQAVLDVIKEAEANSAFNGINLLIMQDEADSVTSSLSDLLNAGLLGALLSVVVLYAFLRNITTTMVVVLSVPFSICITLGAMYLMGYTLNILSLMGLMLAVGMLVDNAVVVTESIFQEKEHNTDASQATIMGVSKVSLAVIAGTLTTIIVFVPNIIGIKIDVTVFLEHVAIAICISLVASLVLAQTLIPLLATRIKMKPPTKKANDKPNKALELYRRSLIWTLNNRKKAGAIAVAILVSTAIPMQFVTSDDEGNTNRERIWMNYHIQGSYKLEEVEATVAKMESFLYANQDKFHIKQVYTYFTPGYAVSGLTLKDDVPMAISDLKKMIKEEMPSFSRARPSFRWNNRNGGGVRLRLLGHSSDTLMAIADNIIPVLKNIEGFTDVETDTGSKKYELQVSVDRQKAFRFGLNTQQVAQNISLALRGTNLRTFRHAPTGEIDIRLMYDQELQTSLEKLRSLTLVRNDQQHVTLDMVADIKITPRLSRIHRSYRQTSLVIGANLEDGVTTQQARKRIEQVMQHIELPTGYSWSLGGSFKRQDEAQGVMITNMLLAVCMIYVVMAALFESLLLPTSVITSLLFSFTGVFWAFLITGNNMSIMGMIGMLILMGIVVNNGIVLVDRINQLVNQGETVFDAIIHGCMTRVRPILMTVATTVLGLVPLAMGHTQIGGDGPPYSPMAIAIIGGLVFSTATSLFMVPLSYLALLKLRRKTANLIADGRRLANRVVRI